jgi:hypothetical protein
MESGRSMVAIDNIMNVGPAPVQRRWEHPRLLLALSVLAFGLSANALFSNGSFGVGLSPQSDPSYRQAEPAGGGEVSLAAASPVSQTQQACSRIDDIVRTACSLKQRDRDAASIASCRAYELKYTMWSAYGCR